MENATTTSSPALTESQAEALQKFRSELWAEKILRDGDSIGTDDDTLLRFLRARKWNVTASKEMISACQLWRKSVEGKGIDALYREMDPFDFPQRDIVFTYWSMYYHNVDKTGRPINIQHLGSINLPALYEHVTPEKHWRSIFLTAEGLMREILPAASRKAGRHINNGLCIVDLKGFTLSQFWQMRDLVKKSFQVSQDYYPETMGKLIVINAPTSFTYIWGIVKRWLAQETVNKVEILGNAYLEDLLKEIDVDALPASLGGTCECKGLGGCVLSNVGPWLDERGSREATVEPVVKE
ncbi:CRAL/TRIO domain-containing protein [Sistotremastrum suecicum HHB10207 ss-3]|uniref:CRAL/TRIO domain-containing protein n=1 Tax=Sistotremastrum suecicum HHB10207 ss-3 TaxID=1314776 RepID=A0A166AC66_9AGAM|nr:CRAL/TRIO domain-containing protein [Sistotremastrum suecicum HHB10207 ss-3]